MARTGIKLSPKAYHRFMEQEHLIEEMANAMRKVHLGYVADCGRMSPNMEFAWYKYIQFAIKVRDEK